MSQLIFAGLVFSQLLTFASYVVVTAGAAMLQKKANELTLFDGLDADGLKKTRAVYDDVFQSSQFVIPYPQQPEYQLGIAWWIIEFELFIFLFTAAATVFPSMMVRIRRVALSFLPAGLVIVTYLIDGLLYLSRNETAKTVYGKTGINLTLAGLIMVGVSNGLSIIFLGLHEDPAASAHVHAYEAECDVKVKTQGAAKV